ncbi:GntR family transcriptional regulator [Paenibacillus hemerocallicola]|uniref:GntR family transcriptional regulator n=1 Tax=Paenibacillus hemerocallicola TaxID=1172614 RepID=A0A5C4SXB6_9BACL|nr:GntR family transcriptional regulator [Paenibacillus hemerocallicola]TNJ59291.1 GntR family transcriptional regulator [Paenibacillus hemerocallicola]
MQTVHKERKMPRYVEIADLLQEEIENGKYGVNAKMCSESELCRRFRVNRYMLRQSLELLQNMGLIRSHQGKGYYVCEKPLDIRYTITPAMRFSDVMRKLGCTPSARLLRQEKAQPPEHVARALQMDTGEQAYRLEILRYADGIPLTWNVTWLPEAFVPGLPAHLEQEPFQSLYATLESVYRMQLTRIWSTFQAVYPSAQEAGVLHISPNTNLLHIESVMRDEEMRLVEFTSAKYRGDLCQVSIHF